MIKKTTKVIFEDGADERTEEMIGGLPLSKGETVKVKENNKIETYEVVDKTIEVFLGKDEQKANITYVLRKKHD